MMKHTTVVSYINSLQYGREEVLFLRSLILDLGLEEGLRWGVPTYFYMGKMVVSISVFKSYFGLWFHKGVLLTDPLHVLVSGNENTTQTMRQWRFQNMSEIIPEHIKSYLLDAISVEVRNLKVPKQADKPIFIPDELSNVLQNNTALDLAWNKLSKSCRREYAEYIATAKKIETQKSRLQKIIPMILSAKGLNDKYKGGG
ncbi:MAG: YdeI/OmpD-associated family protein [Saprospiraceae bacterium]